MAFYKMNSNGSKYYPVAVTVGKPVTTEELAKEISDSCSMTKGDVFGVLLSLPDMIAKYLSLGRSVHLTGLGNFMHKLHSNAVDSPEEFVFDRDVTGVLVHFIPERHRANNGRYNRNLINRKKIEWLRLPSPADSANGDAGSADAEVESAE